jgi:hypothetical protein
MPAAALEVTRLLAVLGDEDDARSELARLSTVCGWGPVDVALLEMTSAGTVDTADVKAARHFNAIIRPVLWASCACDRIEAFAGPALVPDGTALGSHDEGLSRVQFAGTYRDGGGSTATATVAAPRQVTPPSTEWLVRPQFPGVAPHPDSISALFATVGLHTIAATTDGKIRWHRIAAATRASVDRANAELRTRHRVTLTSIRAL